MNQTQVIQYPEIGKVYKHYKGGKYKVLSLAKHSETQEDMVVYQSIGFGSYHVRPLKMWFEKVSLPGYKSRKVSRFEITRD